MVTDSPKRATHVHRFGPFTQSRLAGTLHRACLEPGCRTVSLDGDDEPSFCDTCGANLDEPHRPGCKADPARCEA